MIATKIEITAKKFLSQKEFYILSLNKDETSCLSMMLKHCMIYPQKDDSDLELLVLEEIRTLLKKKFYLIEHRGKVKLTRAQARTIFLWLNSFHFEGVENILACDIVAQLDRQLI